MKTLFDTNKNLKQYMKDNGVFQWQVAMAMGISESTLLKRLRCELSQSERDQIINAVNEIAKAKSIR